MFWFQQIKSKQFCSFIAYSGSCTTTELSKVLTSCLTAVKNMLLSTVKRYMRYPVKIYFGLSKNSSEILDKLKARDTNATSFSS